MFQTQCKFLVRQISACILLWTGSSANYCTFSYAQVVPDNSLGNETSIVTENVSINGISSELISGGAYRGVNLFHSFQDFNVPDGKGVYFNNPQGVQNIISRVTGANPSIIMGKLGVLGTANLFLLNPNGIIFGYNSSLDLRGSFIATTADSIQFGTQGSFSVPADSDAPPLLTVNPSSLIFSRTNIAPIINYSTQSVGSRPNLDPSLDPGQQVSNLFGLRVPDGKSILLVGGDVILDGGGVNALGGRIEIVSIQDKGTIDLSVNGSNLSLNVPKDLNFGNILLSNNARIDTSGEGGGNIQITGKNIQLTSGSRIVSETFGSLNGGNLVINATEILEINGFGENGQNISTLTTGLGNAGNININTGKLILRSGAQIATSSAGRGTGGSLIVNATDLIELDGTSDDGFNSSLSSSADSLGKGGDVVINTKGDLILKNGASIAVNSGGIFLSDGTFLSAEGSAGDLKIIVGSSMQLLEGSLFVGTFGRGEAGNLDIIASDLIIDKGSITANTFGGKPGGNIKIKVIDLLKIGNESLISAAANGSANGGNIVIDVPILLVLPPTGSKGSDIIASAVGGTGGNITINAQGVFGIKEGKAFEGDERIDNFSNDIDASSQFGPSGQVQINTTTDPSQGLIEIPTTVVDPNSLVAQNPCKKGSESEFTRSGRGGLPTNPTQNLGHDTTQVNLVEPSSTLKRSSAETQRQIPSSQTSGNLPQSQSQQKQIAPAQGWVYDEKGDVVLVAYNPNVISPPRIKQNPACPVQ
jgi:filamentous hemagglutinin family protein